MNEKKIKELQFGLENSEGIVIPIACFKGLSINKKTNLDVLTNNDIIYNMECDIIDNGKMSYGTEWGSNDVYPLTRLSKDNNITSVDIIYKDGTTTELTVKWGDYDCNNNSNQITNKLNFNAIHIAIKPFIQTYTIQEVFELEAGTRIKDENGDTYTIDGYENDKCLRGEKLTAKLVNMKYILL